MTDQGASAASYGDGLLSLSLVAASATPIPVSREPSQENSFMSGSFNGPSSLTGGGSMTKPHPLHKHRRLSSTGQARRRLSDAREAASRPSAVTIQTAAAALSSLAMLSLSESPPPQGISPAAISFVSASGHLQSAPSKPIPIATNGTKIEAHDDDLDLGDSFGSGQVRAEFNGAGISVTSSRSANGKKRGTIFKCESCSKVYRHPSCLIKHRWEHSPHWREASKFLLSKHQQVQLLEAAAILSHLSPSARGGTSLPEDRSLWPSYLSGGLLPPPNTVNASSDTPVSLIHSTSSSVPANSIFASSSARPSSAGSRPRMHNYSIPDVGGLTHFRPGVVGVPTGLGASPEPEHVSAPQRSVPVPVARTDSLAYRESDNGYSFISGSSDAWSSPVSVGFAQSSFRSSSFRSSSISVSVSAMGQSYAESTGGWSLPRSSMRSGSRSRSRSGSASESDFVDVDGDEDLGSRRFGFTSRSWMNDESSARSVSLGQDKIEEEWDGMEMEMEM